MSEITPPLAPEAEPLPPLVVAQPVSPVREEASGNVPVALLAGAGAALVGGLAWAGVVIATRMDIGFLAWFVGAGTGLAVVGIAGRPVGPAARAVAGLLAAAGIVVGKYVIFVHDMKAAFGRQLGSIGISIGYLDTRQMSIFLHNLRTIVQPIYLLWMLLALVAAVRAAGGGNTLPFRRRRA